MKRAEITGIHSFMRYKKGNVNVCARMLSAVGSASLFFDIDIKDAQNSHEEILTAESLLKMTDFKTQHVPYSAQTE